MARSGEDKLKQALAPDDAPGHKKLDRRLLGRLWEYLRPYKWMVLLTLVMSMGLGGLQLLPPLMARRIIDVEIANRDLHGLMVMSGWLMVIYVLTLILSVVFNYLTQWVGQYAMHDLRSKLFRQVLRQDVPYFDRNPVGRLITRLTSDVGTLNELFASGVVAALSDVLVIFGVLALMFYFNWKLTLIVLLCAPYLIAVASLFRKYSRKWYLETRRTLATLNTYLQENITGMRTVQSFNRERRNQAMFDDLNRDYRNSILNTITVMSLFFPAMAFIGILAVAAVTWFGGHQMIAARSNGVMGLTYGELFLFVQCVNMIFHPVRSLSEKFNLLQSAMASSERIFKLLDSEPKIRQPEHPHPVEGINDAIRFEQVKFGYLPGEPVIKGVNFEIRRGQTVAVVGATGSGKTTLINLMTRFYDVEEGRITLDGVDLRELDLQALRRMFAVVLQEVFLFSGTIAENLRLANPDLTDEQLWHILREVNAADFVEELPGSLEAPVSERGSTFSTGQKQLLAFARALAADPQILVLDEATANIDTETEQKIQVATERMLAGRTAFVIAHRLSTIQRADLILVMHHGNIHESGTHEELIARDGLYRRLYEMQYRDEAVTESTGTSE